MDRRVLLVLFFFGSIQFNWELRSKLLDGESNCSAAEWKHTDIDLLLLFNGVLGNVMGRSLRGSTRWHRADLGLINKIHVFCTDQHS